MKIRKGGVFTTIDSKDFGIYQRMGFEKVVNDVLPEPIEQKEPIKVDEQPVVEQQEQPVAELVITDEPELEPEPEPVVEEFEKPKSKKKKK